MAETQHSHHLHPPAHVIADGHASPRASSDLDCDGEGADGDEQDSFASFFQPVAGTCTSSASTPTLLSIETSPSITQDGNDSPMPTDDIAVPVYGYLDRKAKHNKVYGPSPEQAKKPIEKKKDSAQHWQHDLVQAYNKLQLLLDTKPSVPDCSHKEDDNSDNAQNASSSKKPRVTLLNESIAFIEKLLGENKQLKSELAAKEAKATENTNTSKILPAQAAPSESSAKPPTLPSNPQQPVPCTRPRLPLQCSPEQDIAAPASLPGLPIPSIPHRSYTTPAQIASSQDDTLMQICMPKGRLLPAHPGSGVSVALPPSSTSPGAATVTDDAAHPTSATKSAAPWFHKIRPSATAHATAQEDTAAHEKFSVHSSLNDPGVTSDESGLHESTGLPAPQQNGHGFPFGMPCASNTAINANVEFACSPAKPAEHSQIVPRQGYLGSFKLAPMDAVSPGAGCQLAIFNTSRRGSLSADTPNSSPNSGSSDKVIMHLPTMPSLKNIRIHTSTIRGRRQQRKLSNSGLSGNGSSLLAEKNAPGLYVDTVTPEVGTAAFTPGHSVSAAGTAAKVEGNIIGSIDFRPSASAYTTSYELPKLVDAKESASPQDFLQEDCIKDLILSEPKTTCDNTAIKAGLPSVKKEEVHSVSDNTVATPYAFTPQGLPSQVGSVELAASGDQASPPVAAIPDYGTQPGYSRYGPPYFDMQVPRQVPQRSYYVTYSYGPIVTSVPQSFYMPYMPEYPSSTMQQQPVPSQLYSNWCAKQVPHKRKAPGSISSYGVVSDGTSAMQQQMMRPPLYDASVMKHDAVPQMSRGYSGLAQLPYSSVWNYTPMPASAPAKYREQPPMSEITQPLAHQSGASPIGTLPRRLDSIPEHGLPAKRARLE
ncbi:hypothetical protein P389DRAFT_179460 [Cystobasidium minutum MCA 4210]|uniref:uncharacterized protein n=1 Tax=Cystobasidium minutum MCA 4210 TaxID=1397322 RepID=UPI0034CD681C|eukprot:jgi/Rhomi1/179460/fgenesh1_pg.3_\